jgi:hypothetical protein
MAMLHPSSSPRSVFPPEDYACSASTRRQPVKQTRGVPCFLDLARALHESPFLFSAAVRIFRSLQRIGINITPNHYYWPIPDLEELEKRDWAIFTAPPRCDLRLERQLELAREFAEQYGAECRFDSCPVENSYHHGNGYFESCDAEVTYCMVRHWKPQHIIEIGSGYSSRIMVAALQVNKEKDGAVGRLISVDPHPEHVGRDVLGDLVKVITKPVQHVEASLCALLQAGDILFIDSSHVVGGGQRCHTSLPADPSSSSAPGFWCMYMTSFSLTIIRGMRCYEICGFGPNSTYYRRFSVLTPNLK